MVRRQTLPFEMAPFSGDMLVFQGCSPRKGKIWSPIHQTNAQQLVEGSTNLSLCSVFFKPIFREMIKTTRIKKPMDPNIFYGSAQQISSGLRGAITPSKIAQNFTVFKGMRLGHSGGTRMWFFGLPLFYFPTATWVEDGGHHLVSLPGWWFQPTHLKKMLVNMGIFPK